VNPRTNLRQQIGQLIIAGLEGPQLTPLERTWLKLMQPAGVILFRRNIEEPSQVLNLLREVSALTEVPQFRCIDLEGGLVDRLRDLIAPMPSSAAVFATGKRTNYVKHGRLIGQEARALGFNTTFAPVLDLALPISANVMRTRVVSPDPQSVIAYAEAFLDGLAREKVLGCGKHFPGLGGGTLDSHHHMPSIDRTWDQLWSSDVAVFRALASSLPMIMVAHASYPQTRDGRPASISPFWITDVLRKKIGFKGLIISDDMEMGGILTQASIEEAAVEAIAAGTDIIEICKDPALILHAYESLLSHAEKSAAFRKRVEESSRRVLAHKRRHLSATLPRNPSTAAIARLRAAVEQFAKQVAA
jgi:beta-N-acetylhexosaminidase